MARIRQIYQSAAVFVSPSPATGYMFSSGNSGVNLVKQLHRVQSVSLSASQAREDIREFGRLDRIDAVITQPPQVSLNISYYPTNGYNEAVLGFAASGQSNFISGVLDGTQAEKNYFIGMSQEGYDINGNSNSGVNSCISVGNGFISNYSLNLAVGSVANASITIEGANAQFDTGTWLKATPAIIPENGQQVSDVYYTLPIATDGTGANIASALRPGDIICEFPENAALGGYASGAKSFNLQSISISVPMSLNPIQRLGSPFPFAKTLNLPITATLSMDALATEIRESKISDLLCNDPFQNFRIKLKNPACGGTGSNAIVIDVRNVKLDSTDWNLDVGSNAATTRLTYSAQLGAVNSQAGLYFSGSYSL